MFFPSTMRGGIGKPYLTIFCGGRGERYIFSQEMFIRVILRLHIEFQSYIMPRNGQKVCVRCDGVA